MEYIKLFEDYNQGLTLYHGSFYKFDRFDFSKLSKQGSQNTYGVGVYLTDNIDYAKSYISGENGSIGEKGYLYEVVLKPCGFCMLLYKFHRYILILDM